MTRWSALLLITFFTRGSTVPVTTEYIAWQDEPNGRGTFSILSSCIVTLVLCVYTAIHMNVPAAAQKPLERRLYLTAWILAGIFCPELVVWVAWCQWSQARALTKELKAICGDDAGMDSDAVPLKTYMGKYRSAQELFDMWSIKHSFFVLMGGYQFHPTVVKKATGQLQFDKPRAVLNAECFKALIRHGHAKNIPFLSAQDIADRSKADNLAKLLSLVQGLWLVIQLLGRLIGRLTITELEVNTFAHVLCATAMYVFWMSKPLNVEQPAWVDSEGLETFILYHAGLGYVRGTHLADQYRSMHVPATSTSWPYTHVHTQYKISDRCAQCLSNTTFHQSRSRLCLELDWTVTMEAETVASKLNRLNQDPNSKHFFDFVIKAGSEEASPGYSRDVDAPYESRFRVDKTQLDTILYIWALPDKDEQIARFLDLRDETYNVKYEGSMIPSGATDNPWRMLSIIAISSMYGGVHATLWNHHFPTAAEKWLWRMSALTVAGNGLLAVAGFLLDMITTADEEEQLKCVVFGYDVFQLIRGPFNFVFHDIMDDGPGWISWPSRLVLSAAICVVLVLQFVFVFSRLFLFIEAFISLRSQPPSAYLTPQWSQWFPHL